LLPETGVTVTTYSGISLASSLGLQEKKTVVNNNVIEQAKVNRFINILVELLKLSQDSDMKKRFN
jgi:hypothetical protein